MSDQPAETPPQAAPQPAQQAEANGTAPAVQADLELDLGRELRLLVRAVEDVDMRLQSVQIGVMIICGLALLTLALNLRRLKQ